MNKQTSNLSDIDLDKVSGGFVYIAVVVGSFLAGTGIRMGLDKIAEKVGEGQGTLKGIKPMGKH
jgi:hypothetical protein